MDKQNRAQYEKVLADLESQKKVIDNGIAAMRALLGNPAISAVDDHVPASHSHHAGNNTEIRPDTFFNLSVVAAAKKFLEMSRAPKSSQEIADALEKGGVKHKAQNFKLTVQTLLKRRAREKADIAKVARGQWGLLAWYTKGKNSNSPA